MELIKDNKRTLIFEKTANNKLILKDNNTMQLDNHIYSVLNFLAFNYDDPNFQDFTETFRKIRILEQMKLIPTKKEPTAGKDEYNFDKMMLIKNKDNFLKLFAELDLNIIDFELDQSDELQLIKKQIFSENQKINFLLESEGTKKLIQLSTLIYSAIQNGETLFIDELNINLHPKLLAYILELFHSDENKNAQLIFSSHDIYILDAKYLKKDEIYFAALNEGYKTDLYTLADFGKSVRESSSFAKKYMEGDFGAIPFIQKTFGWLKK